MKRFFYWAVALLLLGIQGSAWGQETSFRGLPAQDYYLLPSFGEGMIYFSGRPPARGKLNICALDNSLRFLDKDGKELEATNADDIIKVLIDTVAFLRKDGIFYHLTPVSSDIGIALRREIKISKDEKPGAYGTVSQTTATSEYSTIYADGVAYNLGKGDLAYKVRETCFLYQGNDVLPVSKKSIRKLFPNKKADVDQYFKAGNPVPDTVEDIRALLAKFL